MKNRLKQAIMDRVQGGRKTTKRQERLRSRIRAALSLTTLAGRDLQEEGVKTLGAEKITVSSTSSPGEDLKGDDDQLLNELKNQLDYDNDYMANGSEAPQKTQTNGEKLFSKSKKK